MSCVGRSGCRRLTAAMPQCCCSWYFKSAKNRLTELTLFFIRSDKSRHVICARWVARAGRRSKNLKGHLMLQFYLMEHVSQLILSKSGGTCRHFLVHSFTFFNYETCQIAIGIDKTSNFWAFFQKKGKRDLISITIFFKNYIAF